MNPSSEPPTESSGSKILRAGTPGSSSLWTKVVAFAGLFGILLIIMLLVRGVSHSPNHSVAGFEGKIFETITYSASNLTVRRFGWYKADRVITVMGDTADIRKARMRLIDFGARTTREQVGTSHLPEEHFSSVPPASLADKGSTMFHKTGAVRKIEGRESFEYALSDARYQQYAETRWWLAANYPKDVEESYLAVLESSNERSEDTWGPILGIRELGMFPIQCDLYQSGRLIQTTTVDSFQRVAVDPSEFRR